MPRFDRGDETPEALTQLAVELVGRGSAVVDVTVERFLAVANAVAWKDLTLVRTVLAGVRGGSAGLTLVPPWLEDRLDQHLDTQTCRRGLVDARELAVFRRLGEVPCLLSEPSTVDLRITPTDLLARLRAYQQVGASASEADLFLALTRLDTAADDDLRAELEQIAVPVLLQSGQPMPSAAGPAVRRYLEDPVVEAVPGPSGWVGWDPPASLREFPDRLTVRGTSATGHRLCDTAVLFPAWSAAPLVKEMATARGFLPSDIGLMMRQIARGALPLSTDAVLDFLTIRCLVPAAEADATLGLREAWKHGLLRPGPPGVRHLARDTLPDSLGSTARSLGEAARDGLLAVVWQILDDLAGLAASGVRLAAGGADVVETVAALLPEVRRAVANGLADPAVLTVPGTRAMAARTGSSRAVTLAREIVAGLVPAVVPVETGPRFDEIWPEGAGTLPAVVDDATLSVAWEDTSAVRLRFDLTLLDHPGVRFQVVKGWICDLADEGQCQVFRCLPDGSPARPARLELGQNVVEYFSAVGGEWLHWDATTNRLAVARYRNRDRMAL